MVSRHTARRHRALLIWMKRAQRWTNDNDRGSVPSGRAAARIMDCQRNAANRHAANISTFASDIAGDRARRLHFGFCFRIYRRSRHAIKSHYRPVPQLARAVANSRSRRPGCRGDLKLLNKRADLINLALLFAVGCALVTILLMIVAFAYALALLTRRASPCCSLRAGSFRGFPDKICPRKSGSRSRTRTILIE